MQQSGGQGADEGRKVTERLDLGDSLDHGGQFERDLTVMKDVWRVS